MAKAQRAKPLNRAEQARRKIKRGEFPELEVILAKMREIYVKDGEIVSGDMDDFEAPEGYPWQALIEHVESLTGKTVQALMTDTLAGFPTYFDMHFQYYLHFDKLKGKSNHDVEGPNNLPWSVLLAALSDEEKSIRKKATKQDVRNGLAEKDRKKPNWQRKMPSSVTSAIKSYQTHIEEKEATETARKEREARRLEALKAVPLRTSRFSAQGRTTAPNVIRSDQEPTAQMLAPAETNTETRPTGRKSYDIVVVADGLRDWVRENKVIPTSDSNAKIMCGKVSVRLDTLNTHFTKGKIRRADTIPTMTKFKRRIGLLNEGVYKFHQPTITCSAREAFNAVAKYAELKKGKLPSLHNATGPTKYKLPSDEIEMTPSQLSIAFQRGAITGWEELVTELLARDTNLTDNFNLTPETPVPVCLYDFMAATGFAYRDVNYDIKPFTAFPLPKPLPEAA